VTKKFVKFAPYAAAELRKRSTPINLCSFPSDSVISKTFGSMKTTAGNKNTTAIGDIYRSKFIEFNFSLVG
jgi:hypothetical protein